MMLVLGQKSNNIFINAPRIKFKLKSRPYLQKSRTSRSGRNLTTKVAARTEKPTTMTTSQFLKSMGVVGISMGIGDGLSQILKQQTFDINFERSATMVFIGTLITAPVSLKFQIFLERSVPGNSMVTVFKKVGYASAWAFVISIPLVFTATTLLQRNIKGKYGTLRQARQKIMKDLVPTFVMGSLYWPFFNILLFKFVKLQYRAVASSLIGTIWQIYLAGIANSHINHRRTLKLG